MCAIREAQNAPIPGARDLPVLTGLSPSGTFQEPQENVLFYARDQLVQSGRVYRYGDSIVFETKTSANGPGLTPLRNGSAIETSARALLSNLIVCASKGNQFP